MTESAKTSANLFVGMEAQLDAIDTRQLRRRQQYAEGPSLSTIQFDGREYVNFSSNNYLNLAHDPNVIAAAKAATDRFGAGAGGSRLITGSMAIHRELETAIARFKGTGCAVVFSSGYLANLGLIQTLAQRDGPTPLPIFFDRLAHACIVDGVMLAGRPWRSFPHNDVAAVERLLMGTKSEMSHHGYRAIVVTEGVFSMDGDIAPLADLLSVCEKQNALLVVDDAHGTGTIGPNGRGAAAHCGIAGAHNLIQMGTLSKALGAMGGFVAGPQVLCDLLINRARAYIFETALAPASVGAALTSLQLLEKEPERVAALRSNIAQTVTALKDRGMQVATSETPIIPVIIGDAGNTLRVSEALRSEGFLVVAIRPPTVRPGSSRLRITVMSSHTEDQINGLAASLAKAISVL
ncbi:MAG: 8-amino-7-oxononanoate synthase [Candidatus Sumerlaeaceae bacterium]|nr:8-amino-7-oxononanoate synthase [Candidatus Sumerlaeaceae bacterium]